MPDVFILADSPDAIASSHLTSLPFVEMKRAILAHVNSSQVSSFSSGGLIQPEHVDILFVSELEGAREVLQRQSSLLCPLTFNIPDWCYFPAREVFSACTDIDRMRRHVAEWLYPVGNGVYWQPIVVTVKGMLFAEAIASSDRDASRFRQPLHLADAKRQPLYELGQRLLRSLAAMPGVYLMQFGMDERQIWFDRLIPFPDLPAIASIGVQTPDLFECHWKCLTQQPIRDLSIKSVKIDESK